MVHTFLAKAKRFVYLFRSALFFTLFIIVLRFQDVFSALIKDMIKTKKFKNIRQTLQTPIKLDRD